MDIKKYAIFNQLCVFLYLISLRLELIHKSIVLVTMLRKIMALNSISKPFWETRMH